jgi:hypothetical protein
VRPHHDQASHFKIKEKRHAKDLQIVLVFGSLLLLSCDERPSERRARREEQEARQREGALAETRQIQLGNAASLRLDLEDTGGDLRLERETTGLLADFQLEFDHEENRPFIDYDSSSSPTLRIRSPHQRNGDLSLDQFRDNNWRIKVSPQIPIDIRIDGGAIDGRLDFTALKVAELNINVGAGELYLEFGEPNSERPRLSINSGAAETKAEGLCNANFHRFDFNGGVGTSRLSFDGEWKSDGRVDLNWASAKIRFCYPDRSVRKSAKPARFFLPSACTAFKSAAAITIRKITIRPPGISISTSKWASGILPSSGWIDGSLVYWSDGVMKFTPSLHRSNGPANRKLISSRKFLTAIDWLDLIRKVHQSFNGRLEQHDDLTCLVVRIF